MKRKRIPLKYCVALLLWLAVVPITRAQYQDWIEQQENSPFNPVPRLQYVRTDVEAERDSTHSAGTAGNQDFSRLYLSPRLGITWNNYIYHPYLLTYSMALEPGYVWEDRTADGHGFTSDEAIVDGIIKVNLLEVKPYGTSLYYSRLHDETRYSFFDTAIVDSQGWGASSGYRTGPVPLQISFDQSHEDSQDFNQDIITDQAQLNLHARNGRQKEDTTDLSYQFSQFNRTTKGPSYDFTSRNTYNYAALTDLEHFEHSELNSAARLETVDTGGWSSTDANVAANYNVNHGGGLHSFYNYSLTSFNGSGSDSIQNYAVAGLQHQLYESLGSSIDIHGNQISSSSTGSSFDLQSIGTTASANYNKRLGDWGHLFLENSTSYDFTEQQLSGAQLQIDHESHVVPTNSIVVLKQPRDTSIISITSSNSIPLQPGDYTLIQSTDPWRIAISSTGPSKIQPGATIFVSYTAQAPPSGNYSVFANVSEIRLSFLHDYMDVFGRYSFSDTSASSRALLLENDELLQAGADFTWRNFSLNGVYTDEHSSFFHNRSYNFAETYSRSISARSSASIILNQQWSTTSSSGFEGSPAIVEQQFNFYNFMVQYNWWPVSTVNWHSEVGYQRQEGFGLNQNLFAARTYVNWVIGKLQVHLGYEHEDEDFERQTRKQDFVFLRMRRDF